ncbi:hypothetical protein CALCODRAFT_515392 [Calocera cornea HHB12733]|uniref:Transmembrane protein n=1 Tax=Calocera cornea HHB12733 TaxID=1353952 RepID=A0A165ID57_9BASI|nr:hypothetical protein CALCODRAFT_515392 [Calocera cornea HHB12733]
MATPRRNGPFSGPQTTLYPPSASTQLQRVDSGRAPPKRQRTQEEQDNLDDQARHEAMHNLVQSWQDRLQLIALITTFFAAAEINFLVITTEDDTSSAVRQTANACFNGAVVFHAFSATVSFLAAFLLVGYKLKEAKKEQKEAETGVESPEDDKTAKAEEGRGDQPQAQGESIRPPAPPQALNGTIFPPSAPNAPIAPGNAPHAPMPPFARSGSPFQRPSFSGSKPSDLLPNLSIPFSANPRMVQTYFFGSTKPPVHLLERLHALCTCTALNGFVLAFVGIICYAWAWHVRSVGIFTSACLASCLAATVIFISTGNYVIEDDE